jgi:hypothetical protein
MNIRWVAFFLIVSLVSQNASAADVSVEGRSTTLPGKIVKPKSSIQEPGDAGRRSHTNVEIYRPFGDQVSTPRGVVGHGPSLRGPNY